MLERIEDIIQGGGTCGPEDGEIMLEAMNKMLDGLLENDFFGTEGQLDPRGDHRG